MAEEEIGDPALTAQLMVEAFGYNVELAPQVILAFDSGLLPGRSTLRNQRTRPQRKRRHPFRAVRSLSPTVDMVIAAGPGAPVAAITVEFLAALGARRVVSVGRAGALVGGGGAQRFVVERAESDEGTSRFYGGNLTADPGLTDALVTDLAAPRGVALTTDVPFRHGPDRLAGHRQRAHLVEMECAALFAASHHFGLAAAAVLITSDEFTGDSWSNLPAKPSQEMLERTVVNVIQLLDPVRD